MLHEEGLRDHKTLLESREIGRKIPENGKRPLCYDNLWETKVMIDNAPRAPAEVVIRALYACAKLRGMRVDGGVVIYSGRLRLRSAWRCRSDVSRDRR